MRHPVLRSIAAVVLSIVAAVVLFMMIEGISSILHPWPEYFSGTFEEIERQVETYPAWVLALLGGVGYGATMLVCTFIATRLGHNRSPWHGYGVGLFLFALVGYNLIALPYPMWFRVLMIVVLPLAAYAGTRLGGRGSREARG